MKIELLAPAKDVSIGRSAILSGADAIYIGGDRFGARVNAGNSMGEIELLVRYAHSFGVKVYMTMNTILYDNELKQATQQAFDAYNAGVDALIVQDMAYLEMGLPIELHASTQTFNYTAERVKFLEDVGFARVVLERALNLEEIKDIRSKTNVELEAFIHGAICVGYSGQCYLSQAVTKRSGNRGECAQLCRSNYKLFDGQGKVLASDEAVLSVGDMFMGDRVKELIASGVCSLKIEGRLKNETYVVNNTAYYNKILNDLGLERSSSGSVEVRFESDPRKSFLRVPTRYFFDDKRNKVAAPTRSIGEKIGVVEHIFKGGMVVSTSEVINNGDGLCWFSGEGLSGASVNKVEGKKILADGIENIAVGKEVYRNFDRKFEPSSKDVDRKIGVKIVVGDIIEAIDSDSFRAELKMPSGEIAQNKERALESLKSGFYKSGDTIFRVEEVVIEGDAVFLPNSVINGLRRELLEKLTEVRVANYKRRERVFVEPIVELGSSLDYLANVSNELAREFYRKLGVFDFEEVVELSCEVENRVLLRSRYCVRRERGLCPRDNKSQKANPLFIQNNGRIFRLEFDCKKCEMELYLEK